jgi:transposase
VPRLRHSASAKHLSSWVGACPGEDESARVSDSHRSPNGNRHMRRILDQCAKAAAKSKGTIFQIVYGRLVSRLGHNQTIGAIAHRLCRLIWIILHQAVRYEERGPAVNAKSRRRRTNRMIRELRRPRVPGRSTGYSSMRARIFDLANLFHFERSRGKATE